MYQYLSFGGEYESEVTSLQGVQKFLYQAMSWTVQDPPGGHQIPTNHSKEEPGEGQGFSIAADLAWGIWTHTPFTRMFFMP